MSLDDDTVLCIEVEDDSSFLWNDLLTPCTWGVADIGGFALYVKNAYPQNLSDL